MKITFPIVLAMATAPSLAQGWSLRPSYFPSLLDTESSAVGLLRRQRDLANRMLEATDRMMQQQQSGSFLSTYSSFPRFEMVDDDEKFQVSLEVPGVKAEDMSISLEKDGYITIRGERVAKTENSHFASKFSQTFSLDPAIDVETFNANLDHGVLVISATKDKSKMEERVRKIPIGTGAAVTHALDGTTPTTTHQEDEIAEEVMTAPKTGEPITIHGKPSEEEHAKRGVVELLDEMTADA